MACGFDAGTYNLVCCKRDESNNFLYKREVNAFIEFPIKDKFVFNMMKNAVDDKGNPCVPLIEWPDQNVAYALGEAAMRFAYSMPTLEVKRPMSSGCLNPKEKHAQQIMAIMAHSLIDESKPKETLFYSVPANAVNQETDSDYHSMVLKSMFDGFKDDKGNTVNAQPINEALALVYAELGAKMYTGLAISCLCPGTKIYTKNGIKNIEEVKVGDMVLTHKGRWRAVYNIIEKQFKGKSTSLKVAGYASNFDDYKFVDNHELYVKRNNKWDWLGCDELKVGDIVGEPIDQEVNKYESIMLEKRTTCSKITSIQEISLTNEFFELIGYFLGDGSVNLKEKCIQFDFANKEEDNILRIQQLLKIVFNKNSSLTKKSENCTRIKCYSKNITKWFKENCYSEIKEKTFNYNVGSLTNEQAKSLLIGLIMSDGKISHDKVSFYNSSTELIILCKQLLSKLEIGASMSYRGVRKGGIIDGRQIISKKNSWAVETGSSDSYEKLNKFLNCGEIKVEHNSKRIWIEDGFCCSRINNLQHDEYEGIVYDLQVAEDHSFSGPNLTIKNCGAGMLNICYAMYGSPVFSFAVVNSGDWIDQQAAKATGESIAFINKEKMSVNLLKESDSLVQNAIKMQYQLMIQRAVAGIKKAFDEAGNKVRAEHPLDVVVAGGTSSPNGFETIFEKALKAVSLPVEIGKVIKPSDPLYAVARGCLIAAEASEKE